MNVIDKMVETVSPEMAVKRQRARGVLAIYNAQLDNLDKFMNSGYSNGGASRRKRFAKKWKFTSGSPKRDIEENRKILRERSRDLAMNTPLGAAAINSTRTNTIGCGLIPKPKIDYEFLGLSREEARTLEKEIRQEFRIWAESTLCDTSDQNDFYELQQIAFSDWLKNGEEFVLISYDEEREYQPYQLRIRLLEGDRVSKPGSLNGDYFTEALLRAENSSMVFCSW